MVHQRPRTERTRCVVGDNRRLDIDGYDSSGTVRQWPRDSTILESVLPESIMMTKNQLKTIMSDREILLKQWRNLPTDNRVTWETFKRQQRPKIVRQSRPDDWE